MKKNKEEIKNETIDGKEAIKRIKDGARHIYHSIIKGDIDLSYMTFDRSLRFDYSHIEGSLTLKGIKIVEENRSIIAKDLAVQNTVVEGDLDISEVDIQGDIDLFWSTIKGSLTLRGADVENNVLLSKEAGEMDISRIRAKRLIARMIVTPYLDISNSVSEMVEISGKVDRCFLWKTRTEELCLAGLKAKEIYVDPKKAQLVHFAAPTCPIVVRKKR